MDTFSFEAKAILLGVFCNLNFYLGKVVSYRLAIHETFYCVQMFDSA